MESQNCFSETYDSNREIMFAHTADPKDKSIPQFREKCIYCLKCNHSVSNWFRKQQKDGEKNGINLIFDQIARKVC